MLGCRAAQPQGGRQHDVGGSARHADTTAVIGTALQHKADGLGYRRIAAILERPESTVRRWLRRATPEHLQWIYQQGMQRLTQLAPDTLAELRYTGNLLRHALTVLAAAAYWDRHRCGLTDPPWTLIGLDTRGRLLARPAETTLAPRRTIHPGAVLRRAGNRPSSCRSPRQRADHHVIATTIARIHVCIESDGIIVIFSAGQQGGRPAPSGRIVFTRFRSGPRVRPVPDTAARRGEDHVEVGDQGVLARREPERDTPSTGG